jgi:hypothetical protein
MTSITLRRGVIALALAMTAAGIGASATTAQEYLGSAVTVGGGTNGVGHGDVVVVAPGVTISGGDVSNGTDIGVDSGGGSSIGTTAGGSDSAAVVE